MKAELNRAYKENDTDTIGRLMYNIAGAVCAKFKIHINETEEITQDLVFTCFRKTIDKDLSTKGNIFSYFYTLMCNRYRDILRREKMKSRVAPTSSIENNTELLTYAI